MTTPKKVLPLTLCLVATTGLRAQFAEGFDSQATADVTVLAQPDTAVTYVDYSNMTIGAATFSIPEAPRKIDGTASTRGVLIQCNLASGAAVGVNLLAGATPISFSGRYRLSYDAYINVPLPLPNGSTEQLLWGVGTDNAGPIEARNTRNTGTIGVWGWLAGENGYSTEDSVINLDGVALSQLGDTQSGQDVAFNEAFDSNSVGGPNGCAANTWVRVDIEVEPAGVRVFYNGVEFHNEAGLIPSGFAMIGYEDPFSSLGSNPDAQWGLFDNFRVTLPNGCGTPGTAVAQGTATAGEILNGGAPPAVSAPLTVRLRGGPVSSVAFLAAGDPAPLTIPVPLSANCTLNLELVTLLTTLGVSTNADGGAQLSFNVPDNPAFCGQMLGFQWLWLDPANPQCPFALTEGLAATFGS